MVTQCRGIYNDNKFNFNYWHFQDRNKDSEIRRSSLSVKSRGKGSYNFQEVSFCFKVMIFSVVSGCIYVESIDWMTFSGFKLVDKISATLARRNPFQSRGDRSSCSGHLGLCHLELRGGQEGALSRLEDLVHRPFYLALHWISRRLASIRYISLFQVTLNNSFSIYLMYRAWGHQKCFCEFTKVS